ncbi:hypothetical protein BT93_C2111 [Corymbia citriodora subsp. variegata]|nr:hypothetical protein BT93_C2111 [Corymbia citriodora subsp. variegata]
MIMALSYKSFSFHPKVEAKFDSLPPCHLIESYHLCYIFGSKICGNRIHTQHNSLGL